MRAPRGKERSRSGFTLAEVAVTIAVVGLALVWMLQGLHTSKVTALQTRNLKLAKELALLTLGQIESGLYVDDIDSDRLIGTYADEGYPDFSFEAVFGDEELAPEYGTEAFDNWADERARQEKDDEEDVEQAYEKVRIKVSFPQVQELKSEVVLERWFPWGQIHPPEEGAEGQGQDASAAGQGSKP